MARISAIRKAVSEVGVEPFDLALGNLGTFPTKAGVIWCGVKDGELTAVVRSRQLHIYRNGKKILVLAGKAQPKIIREDDLNVLVEQILQRKP